MQTFYETRTRSTWSKRLIIPLICFPLLQFKKFKENVCFFLAMYKIFGLRIPQKDGI